MAAVKGIRRRMTMMNRYLIAALVVAGGLTLLGCDKTTAQAKDLPACDSESAQDLYQNV
jgi:hypothetical protein